MRHSIAEIIGANGTRTRVERRKLPEDAAIEATARPSGPRNSRELARTLDALSSKVRRIPPPGDRGPASFHEAKSEIARELQLLAEWAQGQG